LRRDGISFKCAQETQCVSEESIPQDVRRFIAEHIQSVVVLEVLLLMHREPAREWGADELGRELRVDPAWTQQELAALAQRGVIRQHAGDPPRYAYETTNASHQTVTALAEAYAQRRVTVISLIFARPADALQSFADALKLRKDRHDG
jgi:DNA-binding HxlR family transcriptional regulator